jgi:hypothetical protein
MSAFGYQAKLGIGDTIPTTTVITIDGESLTRSDQLADLSGMRGTRSHQATRVRVASQSVGGVINMTPTPVEMVPVIKYTMGGTPVGTSYPFAEALSSFAVQKVVSDNLRYDYSGLKAASLNFTSSAGQALRLTLGVFGTTRATGAASGFPALTYDNTTNPFMHSDATGAFVVAGTTIDVFDVSVSIDNAVQGRNVNSLTPTLVYSTDRIVTWSATVPFADAEGLINLSSGGVAVSMTWTNGTVSLALSSPKVAFQNQDPAVTGRDETRLVLAGQGRYSVTPGDELAVLLDSSP